MALKINDLFGPINNALHRICTVNAIKELFGFNNNTSDGSVHIGGEGSGVTSIQFDLDPTVAVHQEGQMHWDAANNTLTMGMKGGTVELQVGQEMLVRCKNASAVDIPDGSSVYVDDAGDSKPRIALAEADAVNPLPEACVIGLATEFIAKGAIGWVCTNGMVRGLDTSGITEGVPIFLSSTAGEWTETAPTAPDVTVMIGYCIYSHSSNGIIYVHVIPFPRITSASDVFGTPSDGDTIRWSTANSRFEFGA